MFRTRCYILNCFVLLTGTLLIGCDAVQLCGEYACVRYQNECDSSRNCSQARQCESAGSIRDRAPRIINQLREAQRSCGINVGIANGNTSNLSWDETLANVSQSHARDMANNRFESFVGSNGLSTSDRVLSAGIESLTVFESVASGPQTAAEVINRWLDINTDCQHLIAASTTRIGMACAVRELDNSGPYWSLLLAGPEP